MALPGPSRDLSGGFRIRSSFPRLVQPIFLVVLRKKLVLAVKGGGDTSVITDGEGER